MAAKVTLTITEGQLEGKEFPFDSRSTCLIGRSPDCNIQIPNDKFHSTISRYHCFLDINPPAIRVRDFGRLHGTYVNGKCIGKRGENQTPTEGQQLELSEYDLQDGDVIKLSFTMEYCDRGSVINLMENRGGKLTVAEATEIILQVLDGLHYAHTEKGLVHRDIKPGNIFLTVNKGKIISPTPSHLDKL